ncbi:MAG: hypothetical protein LBR64_04460 [Dysgonamonadaceae bacterium]|jgi:hypothetical protein|nr:hypothetical protein [Dysgonamonadaceae bacterium]
MKKILILSALFMGISTVMFSQKNEFKISVQHGYFNAGKAFDRVVPGKNTGLDISYFLTNHFFLTGHFNFGKSDYYETSMTKFPDDRLYRRKGSDLWTNTELIINNIGLMAGYFQPIGKFVNLSGQIGFSQFICTSSQFPLRIVWADDEDLSYRMSNADNTRYSAAFPVKFSLGVTPFKRMNIGIARNLEIAYVLGFYMEPDYTFFTGIYHGPQLSISF